MNNYILTSDSYITIVYQTNSYTYNYIKTDNTYLHPYEFKTTDRPLPRALSEYIYIDNINNDLFIPYWKNPNNDGDADGTGTSSLTIKAWGVATIQEAAEIGGTTSDSSQLIIKNSLNEYNCQLKDTTTVEYTDNKCVNYIDIEKINVEPDVFVYHIYLNHNTGFMTENSNNLIYEKTQESGWDEEKPQNYSDSIRTDIDLIIRGSQLGHIGDILKPLAPASEKRYYTYDTYTNMYYSYTLYSNNTCTYEWGFNSDRGEGSWGGTTGNITCFVGNIVPPTGEDFDGDAIYSTELPLYFEKDYTNATINGKTIKLCLTIR